MNELMKFQFENSENLECVELNGETLFNPYSVGKCLGIFKTTVRDHISEMDEEDRVLIKNSDVDSNRIRTLNNRGEVFLRESGMYLMVFKSRKPEAQNFVKWVARKVLPSIRKTGEFSAQPQLPSSNPMELEFNIKKLEDLKIAKAPEISNINKQSARGKLNTLITTLSHEKKIGTGVLYDRLYARYAEYKGLFIPLEAERMGKDNSWYLRHHATISEELYEFALTYFYHGKTVVELFNLDPGQKTLGEF